MTSVAVGSGVSALPLLPNTAYRHPLVRLDGEHELLLATPDKEPQRALRALPIVMKRGEPAGGTFMQHGVLVGPERGPRSHDDAALHGDAVPNHCGHIQNTRRNVWGERGACFESFVPILVGRKCSKGATTPLRSTV
jgi:hypothetical protein